MKHLFIFFLIFASIGETSAQKPWKWTQLKGPNVGSAGFTMMFDENNQIIAVGTHGYYLSPNGGMTWDYHPVIPGTGPLCSVYGSSPYYLKNSGLFISSSGEYFFYFRSCDNRDTTTNGVYRSTDRGNTWKQV